MGSAIHTFANGVRVYDDHLLAEQRARYAQHNVHEADEEEIFLQLLGQLPAGGCFVDVGAAIGYYVILARKLRPDLAIHAFEPLPRHRDFLLENLALNNLAADSVTIHPEALSNRPGETRFADRGYSSRLSAGASAPKPTISARWKSLLQRLGLRRLKPGGVPLVVAALTLDEFVERLAQPIDLLQLDVQGAEAEVLRGGEAALRRGEVHRLLIGTHGRARGLRLHEECREILLAHGYLIALDQPDSPHQPDGILVANAPAGLNRP